MLAAAAVPFLVKEAAPIAKKLGEGLIKLGEKIKTSADQETKRQSAADKARATGRSGEGVNEPDTKPKAKRTARGKASAAKPKSASTRPRSATRSKP